MSQARGPIVPFAQDQHHAREAPAPMTEEQKSNNVPLLLRRLARHTVYKVGTSEFEIENRYTLKEHFGQGAYGVVCSAFDNQVGQLVAVKKVENILEHKTVTKRTLREIVLLRLFREHENIVKLQRIMRPRFHDFNNLYLITELMETDLDCIIRSPQELSGEHCQFFLYQLLRGLKCIHSAGVVHRDLKPRNLLVNSNCDLKICDFGLARLDASFGAVAGPSNKPPPNMTDYIATRWYRAPEIILSWKRYSKAIDIWAVGCIFAELLGRRPLFPGKDAYHQLKLIVSVLGSPESEEVDSIQRKKSRAFMESLPKRKKVSFAKMFPNASDAACDLLEHLLVMDPEKRYTVEQALEHPYLAQLHCEEDEPIFDHQMVLPEFEFERRAVSQENLRDLIFHEVATHYADNDVEPAVDAQVDHVAKILQSVPLRDVANEHKQRRKSIP